MDHLGRPFLDKTQYWAMKRRKAPEAQILQACGVAEALPEYETERLARIEAPEYLALDTLQEGARTVLEHTAVMHEQILVTLRTHSVHLNRQLLSLDLLRYFSVVLSAAATSHPRWKIKVDLIEDRLRDREDRSSRHLLITDTDTDVRSGKELGFLTLAIANGIRERTILEAANPDLVLDRTLEIPGSGLLSPAS